MSAHTKAKLFTRYFILVWFASLGLNLCQNLLNNSITLFVTSLGRSTGFAGFLGIPYAVMAILMRFFGGSWADRRSRRSLLAFGCLGFGVTALLFGLIPAAGALVVFRAIHGMCFSAGQLACSTINVDVTPPERSRLGIGIFWVSSAVSLGCAGYLVTALSSGGSYSPVFWVSAACGVGAGILALLCNYEKKSPAAQPRANADESAAPAVRGARRFVEPAAFRPAALIFLMAIATSCVSLYLLMFAREAGYSNAGLAMVFATLGMAAGNLASDWFQHKLGARWTLVFAFTVCGVGLTSTALWHNMTTYLIGGTAYGFIQGICMPVLYYLAVHKMPVHRRGVAGGTVYCMLDLGIGVGSYVWGVVIELAGFTATFLSAAGALLLGAVLTLLFYLHGDE